MDTSARIHQTRKWLLATAILGAILVAYGLVMGANLALFIATVVVLILAGAMVVRLFVLYLHHRRPHSQTPAWRPGDTAE